ncbi:MAG TPA: acetyl-CoA C-acetyltransferase [Actinomycetota bacterium]|nr:acetyl-CoA C-acetyltransferase [Actinomycetota bacterium]
MTESVIVAGARTPIGKFLGAFSGLSAADLGGAAIAEALRRSTVAPEQVDYVIMGHVLQGGAGQITARQAAVKGGIGMGVPAVTINKVCLSGLNAIALADQLIRAGEVEMVVAGGMESMTNAPYAMPKARQGARMGNAELVDLMIHDGLWCAFDHCHMGESTDQVNAALGITRAEQDEWAAQSQERAVDAVKGGRLGEEIVAVEAPGRRGAGGRVETDEGVRPGTTPETLARLGPAFVPEGTITAGNASQISDGAAAVVVTSRARAEAEGLPILATILAHGMAAGPDPSLVSQPSHAIQAAAAKLGREPGGFDLYEINEAFAAVALWSSKELGVGPERVNVNGGAIALGHPIGASGARLVLTLAYELSRRGGGIGAAALCGGGGQGDALLIRAGS